MNDIPGTSPIARTIAVLTTVVVLSSCSIAETDRAPASSPAIEPFPEFPWPPPEASASDVLPEVLVRVSPASMTLRDVSNRIADALDQNGYYESSYFAVPGGFALVTRLESIESDGASKNGPDRWSLEVAPLRPFSLAEYLRRLLLGAPGYYRLFAFVVTPYRFSQSEAQVTVEQAERWMTAGLNDLPVDVANLRYTDDFETTALIYEFARPTENDEASLTRPGDLLGREHLERSGILSALQP